MPQPNDTVVRPQDSEIGESASPQGLSQFKVDRYLIKSLRAKTGRIAPTGLTYGLATGESGTFSRANNQWPVEPSNAGAFRLLPPRVSTIPSPTLQPTQEWEGQVTAIRDDEFEARLLDLTAGDAVDREVATIPLEEVGAEDRTLMRIGSIFRWVVGYERSVGGTRRGVSQIVFLDPHRLTERDIEKGREWAEWLLEEWDVE